MAELVRTRGDNEVNVIEMLSSTIPAPFSNQDRAAIASAHHFPSQPATTAVAEDTPPLSSRDDERESTEIAAEHINAQDVNPSLAYVQHTVLTTLHDLLSTSDPWPSTTTAVSPDRRHSMPSPSSASSTATSAAAAATDPLPALLASLRTRNPPNTPMTQIAPPDDARAQLAELRTRVGVLTPSLHPADAELASALTSLLSVLYRLSSSSSSSPTTPAPSTPAAAQPDEDIYDTLSRQLSGIQTQAEHRPQPRHPVRAVEQALLWSQLDVDLETALRLCRARLPSSSAQQQQQQQAAELPPPNYSDADLPPQYVEKAGSRANDDEKASEAPPSPTVTLAGTSEKMRLDFEAVTRAIDRLYSAVPQLHDQRAELRPRPPTSTTNAKGKAKASASSSSSSRPPEAELERMLGMLDKASARRLADQTAPLSPAISERASKRVQARHEAFVGRLMDHATTGRMTAQDAVFTERDHAECKDPEAMLSLPEFIREAPPRGMVAGAAAAGEGERDGEQQQRQQHHGNMKRKSLRALRSRSLSAPSMGWFRDRLSSPSPHVSTHPALSEDEHERGEGDGDGGVERKKKGREGEEEGRIDVAYVAEHHEALRHVLAFVAPPPSSNADLAATFTLDTAASVQEGSLVLRSSSTSTTQANGNGTAHRAPRSTSRPSSASSHKSTKSRLTPPPPSPPITSTTTLPLPTHVPDGKYDLRAQGPHWELKLPVDVVDGEGGGGGVPLPLLDAEQLRDAAPAGFVCGTCSLPIVRFPPTAAHAHEPNGTSTATITPGRVVRFDDLPSEHWAELVDAWMCHSDQALSASVARTAARGFWPEKGQVLVGGSYVLVGAEVVVRESLWEGGEEVGERKPGEEWRSVRCKCGTYSGRCQDHIDDDEGGGGKTTVYRFAKYAIRPVGATIELPRVPLSAYVVEDMNELALAHATYRFVVLDEEEERPRLLLWLFKPSLKLSYAAPRHYLIPRSGTVHAAKVLYKILGPATAGVEFTTLLNRYPGFPQAEHLMYPKDVCTRLAVLLKESSGCYPENLRTMTGLDVGWLLRA